MAEIVIPQSIDNAVDNFEGKGAQNLTVKRLKEFQNLKYGMFVHYGMSTFDGKELSACEPIETYNPTALDVDQWVETAQKAGMKYMVLTTKHVAGHALWPTKYSEYSVKNNKCNIDVVGEFVKSCRKRGIKPCFYYCSWDNTNLFGMKPTYDWAEYSQGMIHTNDEYRKLMWNQIEELLTEYGDIEMLWVDIPHVLPKDKKIELYNYVKSIQPNIIFTFNHSCQDGTSFDPTIFWPSDIMTMERTVPNHAGGHAKKSYYNWKPLLNDMYYIPGEYNDCIGNEWFYEENDQPRGEHELLGMVLSTTSKGVNCLLNVPPSREGIIPEKWSNALYKLKDNLDKIGFFDEDDNIKIK